MAKLQEPNSHNTPLWRLNKIRRMVHKPPLLDAGTIGTWADWSRFDARRMDAEIEASTAEIARRVAGYGGNAQ
jgi:hypothetical protein